VNNMYEDNIRPPQPDVVRAKTHSDVTLYFACRGIDGTHAYLKSQGIAVSDPITTYYKMRQISLKDPDGYSIVFQWPSE
ncbi:MAG TPA: VOC family protein, partial [Terriglobus sp.]